MQPRSLPGYGHWVSAWGQLHRPLPYYRVPVLTAWSTRVPPLLITSLGNFSLAEAIGAFIISSLLITLCGISGWFDRLMRHIPAPLAAAMLAGVLLRFGLDLFKVAPQDPLLLGTLLLAFLLGRHLWHRYTMVLVLAAGMLLCTLRGELQLNEVHWQLSTPVWISPAFSIDALLGIALPLFLVTMTSQNMPGHCHPARPRLSTATSSLIGWTGFIGVLLAPFGGYAFNLAAITAAICMGKEVDHDVTRRWPAAVWAGCFYLLTGCFGATVVALFSAFPCGAGHLRGRAGAARHHRQQLAQRLAAGRGAGSRATDFPRDCLGDHPARGRVCLLGIADRVTLHQVNRLRA